MIARVGHHQIVENAALGVGEQGVTLPPGAEIDDIGGYQRFHRRGRAFALKAHLPHMRDVEQSGRATRMTVLVENTLVLYRHRVPGERNHAGAQFHMQVEQRCSRKSFLRSGFFSHGCILLRSRRPGRAAGRMDRHRCFLYETWLGARRIVIFPAEKCCLFPHPYGDCTLVPSYRTLACQSVETQRIVASSSLTETQA